MDRINGAGNVARMFVAEDIATNRPPTEVTAEWLNAVQEELAHVIEASGAVLDPASVTQLLDALRSAGVFQTPPQFDASAKVATTDFVQRALGNLRGDAVVLAAPTVLTHLQAGNLFVCNSAGGQQTLPPLATAAPGEAFSFLFTLPGAIKANAAEAIQWGSGGGNIKSCMIGETVTVVRRASNWDIQATGFGGESFSALIAANGYQKLPSGLIIQWGILTATTTTTSFNFPISFQSGCLSISAGSNTAAIPIGISPLSTTQFSVTAASGTAICRWIAIGY